MHLTLLGKLCFFPAPALSIPKAHLTASKTDATARQRFTRCSQAHSETPRGGRPLLGRPCPLTTNSAPITVGGELTVSRDHTARLVHHSTALPPQSEQHFPFKEWIQAGSVKTAAQQQKFFEVKKRWMQTAIFRNGLLFLLKKK